MEQGAQIGFAEAGGGTRAMSAAADKMVGCADVIGGEMQGPVGGDAPVFDPALVVVKLPTVVLADDAPCSPGDGGLAPVPGAHLHQQRTHEWCPMPHRALERLRIAPRNIRMGRHPALPLLLCQGTSTSL